MLSINTAPTDPQKRAREAGGPDEIIRLDKTDDIDTLLDRLEWVKGRHALVVVPGSSDMLASLVSLRLLKRRAEALQLDVLLVAQDGQTRTLAHEAGLSAYMTEGGGLVALRRLEKQHGTRLCDIVREERAAPLSANAPGVVPTKARRRPGDRYRLWTLPRRGRFLSQLATLLILVALAAGLAYTVITVVPLATVTVVPATRPVSETVMVTADQEATDVDYQAKVVPARVVEVRIEGSAQVPTTSKRDAPNNRATGKITFANKTAQEVQVPAGTVVRTSTGTNIRFTTAQKVTVPAGLGNRVEADIVAVTPGPSGNVRAYLISTIEGSLSVQLTAVNERPTGGGDVKPVGVVTAGDKERVKTLLLQQLREAAYARIKEQLDEQEFVPPETMAVLVISEQYDKFLDELSDTLGLKMNVVANAVAVPGQHANAVAFDALQAAVPSDYYLAAKGLHFERGEVRQIDEKRRVSFSVTAAGIAVANIDTSGLREALQGQTMEKSQAIVMERLPIKKPPTIDVRPNWSGRMPALPFRINVLVLTELD